MNRPLGRLSVLDIVRGEQPATAGPYPVTALVAAKRRQGPRSWSW
ncbi:hypothetical protein [Streptomyces sp. NPDC002690]